MDTMLDECEPVKGLKDVGCVQNEMRWDGKPESNEDEVVVRWE